ncbi:peptide chain release factor N(5)-glutamine methyltransferase [Chlamydia gallinacea]|nr:peptide chain release factor N(5)-glutamine methyltransferase [Chlamydia gallinacea]MBX6680301.1 peptide chain release factor N(5)-glutamine methyltransferase [Chlamydia gallinacea]MBX6687577.1 peptide chain release factor N(5)-glutamine methyltransferase [Chlamydia gallinacea]
MLIINYYKAVMKKILKQAADYLAYHGIAFPNREAEDVLMDLVGVTSRTCLSTMSLDEAQLLDYWQRIHKRSQRMPAAYIHGHISFLGMPLFVDPRVLIPRAETELLAEKVIHYLRAHPEIKRLYDVCCGSGCLGLAVKKYCPSVDVVLSDICPKAVEISRLNAEYNHLNVEILLGDLFSPYTHRADAFVCNPPYLSFKEILSTDPEVRCYEPWKALVGGNSGTEFYERIARDIHKILAPRGVAWLEIGYQQGCQVTKIFEKYKISGCLYQDLSGWDRIFFLKIM